MGKETILNEYELEKIHQGLIIINKILISGYAGRMSNGNIVDRREFPEAIPIRENIIFNIPKPIE